MSRHFKDVSHAIAGWQPAWQRLKEPSPNGAAGVGEGQRPGMGDHRVIASPKGAESKTLEWKRSATGFTVVLSMRQLA